MNLAQNAYDTDITKKLKTMQVERERRGNICDHN